MPTYVPNAAELLLITHLFKTETPPNLTCHLFKNDLSVTESTVVGDITEADFEGYSDLSLTRANWSNPTTVSGEAEISYGQTLNFASTDEELQTVYGLYLTENTNDQLVYIEKFDVAKTIEEGSNLDITLKLRLSNKDA